MRCESFSLAMPQAVDDHGLFVCRRIVTVLSVGLMDLIVSFFLIHGSCVPRRPTVPSTSGTVFAMWTVTVLHVCMMVETAFHLCQSARLLLCVLTWLTIASVTRNVTRCNVLTML